MLKKEPANRQGAAEESGELHIRLLGGFALSQGGKPVLTMNSPRLQSLLGCLLLHRDSAQTRQHIAFLFWPDSSESQAQSNLRTLLVALRRALPENERYLSTDRQVIQWQSGIRSNMWLDVAEFERILAEADRDRTQISALQKAIDLYAGDLLPSCYDEWVLAPRERLRADFLSALEKLTSYYERNNDLSSAILYAQRMLRQDPLLEENYRHLMRLHLANGDRAGVLNTYKQCTRTLKHELGIEPGGATFQIMQQAKSAARNGQIPLSPTSPTLPSPQVRAAQTPSNLPAQTTIFFGRDTEMAEVAALLRGPDVRLVTLTGTPGTGKTRLGISIAASLVNSFTDGVFFIPLAAVDDPNKVLRTVAAALDVAEPAQGSLLKSLAARIADKHLLLVLDNFEHLLAAAPVMSELLAACPHIKLLATSRSVLNLRGEHEYPVSPLPVPPREVLLRPDALLDYESVALFMDRALEVSPQFALNLQNARSVAEICRQLEGLPLALELAAARVKVLSPAAILSRLDRRLNLLVGGRSDLPPRQRALETAIAWSYNLLDETERALFRTLSVFSGGFTVEAVEAVADPVQPDSPDCIEVLTSLLNKSLITHSQAVAEDERGEGGGPRFAMLETLKEYASARLIELGQNIIISRRHALYFLTLAETATVQLNGPSQQEWVDRVDTEQDNLRAALRWALDQGDAEIALRLVLALGLFWERRGYLNEGRRWIQLALDLESARTSPHRASALYYSGLLAIRQRDHIEAQPLLEESRILYKETGDKQGLSNSLSALAVMTVEKDYEQAVALHKESLELRRQLGDTTGIAKSLQNLGFIKMHQGEWSEASPLTEEALSLYKELGSQSGIAYTTYVLAMIAAGQGEDTLARLRFEEVLTISRKMRNDWLTAWALHGLSHMLYRAGEYEQANKALSESQALFIEMGDKLGIAQTLANMGREAHRTENYDEAAHLYRQALEMGQTLENDHVVAMCLAGFAALAATAGKLRLAAMLFGNAEDLLQVQSTTLERLSFAFNMDDVRETLNAGNPFAWETAMSEGAALPWQDAVSLALAM